MGFLGRVSHSHVDSLKQVGPFMVVGHPPPSSGRLLRGPTRRIKGGEPISSTISFRVAG